MTTTNRIEPAAAEPSTAQRIASFFAFVSAIGCVPAAVGVLMYGLFGLMGVEMVLEVMRESSTFVDRLEFAGGTLLYGAGLFFIWLGFAQLRFYARRARGPVRDSQRWWASTYLYNVLGLGASLFVVYQEPHIGGFIGTIWFALLCGLAIVAYASEDEPEQESRARRLGSKPQHV